MIVGAIEMTQAIIVASVFALITVIGLFAGRWRAGDMDDLDEWSLGGRKFGGILTWFLQGGSVYTTYSFVAVPALVFGTGALGFFALPYLVITYVVAFIVVPRLWTLSAAKGYITPADFVRARFGSRPLALAITITGLVATMPYIALQVYGIELCMSQIGLPVQASLWIAFAVLALVTYVSGLRSATLIAIVKDVFIWVTVIVAVIYIPIHLGGYAHAFSQVPKSHLTLPGNLYADYATLAVGSGLALFLYPHTLTGALSSSSRFVVQRNSIFLPVYTLMLGLLAILGYLAVAAHIPNDPHYGANIAVLKSTPQKQLASWLFVKWFSDQAQTADWGTKSFYMPVRKAAANDEALKSYWSSKDPQGKQAFDVIGGSIPEPNVRGQQEIRDVIFDMLTKVTTGKATPEAAIKDAGTKANDILKANQ